MEPLKATICPARHAATERAEELSKLIIDHIESANLERDWRSFLRDKPEIMGWRFSEGISPATLVRPEFELPDGTVADFLVIDVPQWVQVNLIELEGTDKPPFTKTGKYSEKLNDAVRQTAEWKQAAYDNKPGFVQRLVKAFHEVDDFGPHESLFMEWVLPRLLTGNFRLITSIVIGRRHKLHIDYRDKRVVSFLESTDKDAIFSYDALVDTCLGKRYEPDSKKAK